MKNIVQVLLSLLFFSTALNAQYGDCTSSIEACTNPSFNITPSGFGNVEEFDSFFSNVSNPQTNPNSSPGNDGCMISGELNSTWLLINVSSSGTLEFSLGDGVGSNYYDWIMWPYDANTCDDIANNNQPPVACNYNLNQESFTGMASPGNLPSGASQGNFEYGINVNAGDQFILCFSNWSSASTSVPLDFFGSASVTCGSITDPTICYGETAEINVFDGVSYSWNTSTPGFVNTNAAGDVAYVNPTTTTDYVVDITMSDGSTLQLTSTVTVLPQLNLSSNNTLESCAGNGDGSISFSVSNGTSPFTYVLSGSGSGTNSSGNFNNLSAGNYAVTVTDGNGCEATFNTTLDPAPPCCSLTLTTSSTSVDCFGDCNGSATVNISGATGTTNVQWTQAGIAVPNGTNAAISNLCAGNYDVSVTDDLCTITESVVISSPDELSISATKTDLSCFQDNSGNIDIIATGGTAPYSYSIDNGASFSATSNFNGLSADEYDIIVNDANTCSKTSSVTLSEPDELLVSANIIDNTCHQVNGLCDGAITTTVTGGTGPYSYLWNNTSFLSNVAQACAGTYNVQVADDNGCLVELNNIEVGEPAPVSINSIDVTPPSCNNICDAEIVIIHNNGTNFSIDNGATVSPQNTFSDLCSGNFTIVISDDNGCSIQQSITLTNPAAVTASFSYSPESTTTADPEVTLTNTSSSSSEHYWYYVNQGDTILNFEENPTITFPNDQSRTYPTCIVAQSLNGCSDVACGEITIEDQFFIFVPNSFSPNGDGINETFYPIVNAYNVNDFQFMIFDRWGHLVFSSDSPSVSWDGTKNSTPLPPGVYVWKISTQSEFDNTVQEFTGHVNLFR